MKKILVFAGSNSKSSINKQLAIYAASHLNSVGIQLADLNDFPLPVYGVDDEQEEGIPSNAHLFYKLIEEVDGIILSLAEHNGSYTTVFKNLFDWISRINSKPWNNKPMLLMSTSSGSRGGQSVLDAAKSRFPYMGVKIVGTFSLPSFYDNFYDGKIIEEFLNNELLDEVKQFELAL
ncbi:MAG: NAD(P)H-dependent oxidoreductase [Flavobacteriaceae bacterium]|nr:NAD(P)H-dependent oxidoreductase [Flavobacteriaceae bacterium]